jgi:hypothetical protein
MAESVYAGFHKNSTNNFFGLFYDIVSLDHINPNGNWDWLMTPFAKGA